MQQLTQVLRELLIMMATLVTLVTLVTNNSGDLIPDSVSRPFQLDLLESEQTDPVHV